MNELRRIRLHNLDSGTQAVRHVHHIHESTGCDRANEFLALSGRIVNIDSVIRRTTTRRCYVRDQSGETNRTCVHAETDIIIIA